VPDPERLEVDRVSCRMQSIRTRNTEDNFAALGSAAARRWPRGLFRIAGGRNGHVEVSGEAAPDRRSFWGPRRW
jgi:hypothetical protein